MSPTILQLSHGARKKKNTRPRAGAFEGSPHRKGMYTKSLRCLLVNPIQQKELTPKLD